MHKESEGSGWQTWKEESRQDLQNESRSFEEDYFGTGGYQEETSAELAEPLTLRGRDIQDNETEVEKRNRHRPCCTCSFDYFIVCFPVLLDSRDYSWLCCQKTWRIIRYLGDYDRGYLLSSRFIYTPVLLII